MYVSGNADEAAQFWAQEAATLLDASYGYELIQLIGRVSGKSVLL